MKSVLIDKTFFTLSGSASDGLISGLLKLSQNDFLIGITGGTKLKKSELTKILKNEGIVFGNIDPAESILITLKKPVTKKQGIIFVKPGSAVPNFAVAVDKLIRMQRTVIHVRLTNETDVRIKVSLDGSGKYKVNTGVGFFDHMLEQLSRHSNMDLDISVNGDLKVDEHHTVEDVGIALGEAIAMALGDKKGIKRYGYFLPMDDAVAKCAIDLGGRAFLNFKCKFKREMIGSMPTELFKEFFRGFSAGLKANIYIEAKGENEHHIIEAVFKSVAKSLNEAFRTDPRSKNKIPTTKGLL